MNFLQFFIDPILRAPTWGSMLMGFVAALVGVMVFIRKRSLFGETLSHATYPGVTLAIMIGGFFSLENQMPILVLLGALISALLGFWLIEEMEKRIKTPPDSALCAVLALFFGIGITIASFAQNSYPQLFRQTQTYLYGQAATMTDQHVVIYASLACIVLLFIIVFYREILLLSFDRQFAQAQGVPKKALEPWILLLVVIALVIGIRCVGVILMSAMLIAPAAAARQFTNRLSLMFVLSGFFGVISSFLGVYLSVFLSKKITGHYAVPTGPMIILVSGSCALYALFFAPKRGLIFRYIRAAKFRALCFQENLLKSMWRLGQDGEKEITFKGIIERHGFSSLGARLFLFRLICRDMIEKKGGKYCLTSLGNKRGARIVRLHRLWEVYLVNSLGLKSERVHKSAEEMEHILTPDLEQKLTEMLDNPRKDPHQQPIPLSEE
jgi:manganese/zinc/iron transport system permease protein